jgi:hypothetical protein
MMPLIAMAGLGTPAFQAIATRKLDEHEQGQLQGVLASTTGFSAGLFAVLRAVSRAVARRSVAGRHRHLSLAIPLF